MSDFKIEEAGVLEITLSKNKQLDLFEWLCNGAEGECPVHTKWPDTMPSPPKKGDVFFVFQGTRTDEDGTLSVLFSRRVVSESPYEHSQEDPYRTLDPKEDSFLERIQEYAKEKHNVVLSRSILRRIIEEEVPRVRSTSQVLHAQNEDAFFKTTVDGLEKIGAFKTPIYQGT